MLRGHRVTLRPICEEDLSLLWRLGNDGHIQITQPMPLGLHLGIDIAQQDPAVDAFEFHVIIREVAPDITGGNGAGKTSVLEALHLLAYGRSFRGRVRDGLIRTGAEAVEVFAEWHEDAGGRSRKAGLRHAGQRCQRAAGT